MLDAPDLRQDGGVQFLTDGKRNQTVAFPALTGVSVTPSQPVTVDLARRRVYAFTATNPLQVLSYDLDQRQFRLVMLTLGNVQGYLFPVDNGLLALFPNALVLLRD